MFTRSFQVGVHRALVNAAEDIHDSVISNFES